MQGNTPKSRWAPLKNVAMALELTTALIDRPPHLPSMGVFAGFSGCGKSEAALYVQNKLDAVYLEVFDHWTRKKFCTAFLAELGRPKAQGSIADMMDQIIQLLGDNPERPVIIDETDKLVDKGMIELVRAINMAAQVPMLLIGEEMLPQKLEKHERVHNRVLHFRLAQPCDLDDTRALARHNTPALTFADDLLNHIRHETGGVARRIATTLNQAQEFARNTGLTELDLANYKGRIFTGESPRRHARAA